MATLTKGKTFTNGELVTPQKLHELVDLGTVSGIVNADISNTAAIALSKLATGALPTGITVASANIVDGSIVNADIAAGAAIVDSKLATISTAGKVSNSATTATSANTANAIVARDASGNFSAGTITAALSGNASSATTAAACSGNAATATKLATARTITLGGDLSGSVSFDGSANATLTAAVADDSHNHVISNIDGLQSALDGKQAAGSYAPATGIAPSAISGTAVITTDSRLSDARTPTAHTHAATDITSGTLANARTTATSANTANAIVARDINGSFETGDILINGIIAGKGAGGNTSNTVFGSSALELNTTGYNNTAIGRRALSKNIIHDSCTAVGFDALKNSTGIYNTAVGRSALESNTTGTLNTAIGVNALNAVTSFTNATGLGYNSQVTGSNQVRLGNSSVTAVVSQVGSWSDARDKADIRDTILGLEFIQKLRPVDYKWDFREDYRRQMPVPPHDDASLEEKAAYETEKAKWLDDVKLANISNDGTHKRTRYHHGLIAQEVQEVIAATGVDFGGFQNHAIAGGDDAMTISYIELIGPIIKAVQELAARVAALESAK